MMFLLFRFWEAVLMYSFGIGAREFMGLTWCKELCLST
jgi:hypothetical protein